MSSAVDHFRPYAWGRSFTSIIDSSALAWLFKNRGLSSMLHGWTSCLIEYGMDLDLQWRPGTRHKLAGAFV